jgi:xanthine dehydrogenase accessory factor
MKPSPRNPELWLFGAGHVARQLLKFLPDLNFEVRCFETRENVLGKNADDYRVSIRMFISNSR